MNNIDRQYKQLLEHIRHFGVDKQDRTGILEHLGSTTLIKLKNKDYE